MTHRRTGLAMGLAAMAMVVLQLGCGVHYTPYKKGDHSEPESGDQTKTETEAEPATNFDDRVVPPAEYYDAVMARTISEMDNPDGFSLLEPDTWCAAREPQAITFLHYQHIS